jgi:hypothetical protein
VTDRVLDAYPRGTVDFIPFADLTVNGALVTDSTGIQYSVVPDHGQPAGWSPALVDAETGELGFKLDGPTLGRGVYRVFVRDINNAPDTQPEIIAGRFRLT